MMKNQKGITLIALVITIIVLLILAGVSIAMLTGNNGILTQANNAATSSKTAEAAERINMELNAIYSAALAGEKDLSAITTQAQIETNLGVKSSDSNKAYTVTVSATEVKIIANGVSMTKNTGTVTVAADATKTVTVSPAEK